MTPRKQASVLPIYLVGLVWLGYALCFPLRAPLHYLLCGGLSLAAFTLGKILLPGRVQPPPEREQTQAPKDEDPKLAALRKERERAIFELRRLNDAIPDEKISAQIDHLEEVTGNIIGHVIEQPEKLPQISRFLDYFLPTTLKLLNAYDRMDAAGISGRNIDSTKEKVENMLDTLCAAFDKQLDALFEDEALDISTDIIVMENLLAQEGLGGGAGPRLEL